MATWVGIVLGVGNVIVIITSIIVLVKYKTEQNTADLQNVTKCINTQRDYCNTCSTNMKVFMENQNLTNKISIDSFRGVVEQFEKISERVLRLEKIVAVIEDREERE